MRRTSGATIAPGTIVEYMNFSRDIPIQHYAKYPVVLGSEGAIVEIDESALSRRKYNKAVFLLMPLRFCFPIPGSFSALQTRLSARFSPPAFLINF